MADVNDLLTEEDRRELESARARLVRKRMGERASQAPGVVYLGEDGTFTHSGAGDMYSRDATQPVLAQRPGGSFESVPMEQYLINNEQPFDYSQVQEDWRDVGTAPNPGLPQVVKDNLNTIQNYGDDFYYLDNEGKSFQVAGGEDAAQAMMDKGEARPGDSMLSATRIARKKLRQDPTVDQSPPIPLPKIKQPGLGRAQALLTQPIEEDEEEELP